MVTPEEEAYIANAWKDLEKITKEMAVILNQKVVIYSHPFNVRHDRGNWSIENKNHTVVIQMRIASPFFMLKGQGKWVLDWQLQIFTFVANYITEISHNDFYTRAELEKAKNSVLTNILEKLQRH